MCIKEIKYKDINKYLLTTDNRSLIELVIPMRSDKSTLCNNIIEQNKLSLTLHNSTYYNNTGYDKRHITNTVVLILNKLLIKYKSKHTEYLNLLTEEIINEFVTLTKDKVVIFEDSILSSYDNVTWTSTGMLFYNANLLKELDISVKFVLSLLINVTLTSASKSISVTSHPIQPTTLSILPSDLNYNLSISQIYITSLVPKNIKSLKIVYSKRKTVNVNVVLNYTTQVNKLFNNDNKTIVCIDRVPKAILNNFYKKIPDSLVLLESSSHINTSTIFNDNYLYLDDYNTFMINKYTVEEFTVPISSKEFNVLLFIDNLDIEFVSNVLTLMPHVKLNIIIITSIEELESKLTSANPFLHKQYSHIEYTESPSSYFNINPKLRTNKPRLSENTILKRKYMKDWFDNNTLTTPVLDYAKYKHNNKPTYSKSSFLHYWNQIGK